MEYGLLLRSIALFGALLAGGLGDEAQAADKARISGLTDVGFGQIFTFGNLSVSQSICIYTSTEAYAVIASGSGNGGAFLLNSGSDALAYEVQWAQTSGQTSGSPLQEGVPSQIFSSQANNQNCSGGPSTTATLIIGLGATETANARAGTYSGTLSITIVPD